MDKPKSIKGIPDEIFREAKAEAARQGKTMGQYISEALIYFKTVSKAKK